MGTVTPGINRISFFRGKAFRVIAICLAVIIVVGGVFIFLRVRKQNTNNAVEQRTAKVTRGQLVDSIAGSAPVESANRSELSPKVTATLQQINCKEGEQVNKGDVLFVLDNTDALMNIENIQNQIAQMQLTLDSTAGNVSGLTVNAPFSGQVTGIGLKEGDSVNKGGALMTITDVSTLSVTLPFSGTAAEDIALGQRATVYIPDLMLSVEGTVSYRSNKPYTTASGGELYNVDISIRNPGSLNEGMKATAELKAGGTVLDSVESGSLTYKNKKALRSEAGGTVTSINVRENEFVNSGDLLAKLENEDLVLTSSTNNIKMESLKSQLEIQQKQLDYYTIKAPFDGTVTSMGTANAGDTVKQGELLAVVSDMNRLQFSISIDELDISKIAVGQDVNITAEALSDTKTVPLTGKVTKIAMEGDTSNGVTTYPVAVTVDDNAAGKLKTGMNIDAEILVSNKQNVLLIPLEAVTEIGGRSFVYVKGTDSDQSGQTGENNRFGQGNPSDHNWQNGRPGQGNTPDQSLQNGQPGQSGQDTQTGGNRQNWRNGTGSTSGSGIRRSFRGGNTSGAAIGANTSGTAIGANTPGAAKEANTSGAAFGPNSSGTATGVNLPASKPDTSGTSSESKASGAASGPNASGMASGPNASGAATGASGRSFRQNANSYYNGAVLTEVQTGTSNDTYIEIVGGLSEGQVVVLPKTTASSSTNRGSGQNSVRNGMMGGSFQGGGMQVTRQAFPG